MLQIQAKVDKYLHKALAEASGYMTAWLNQLSACNLGHSPFSVNTILPNGLEIPRFPMLRVPVRKPAVPSPINS